MGFSAGRIRYRITMQAATIPKPLPALNIWGYRGFDSNNVARVEVLFDRINFRNAEGSIEGVLTGATGSKLPAQTVVYGNLKVVENTIASPIIANNDCYTFSITTGSGKAIQWNVRSAASDIYIVAQVSTSTQYNTQITVKNQSGASATVYLDYTRLEPA